MTAPYWFDGPGPGAIGVMPHPEGGRDLELELRGLRRQGVDTLVSLLEAREIELYGLEREGELCAAIGIDFLHHPVRDHTAPPDLEAAAALVRGLAERHRRGGRILVHCLAGIGRSPTIAGAALLELGLPLRDVLRRMTAGRGYPVPEAAEQHEWLRRYASRAGGG